MGIKIDDINLYNYTILIIDDNPTNLGVAVNYLEDSGLTILVSLNGESGVKRAKYASPDIILLDVLMPGIDGFETCDRLKADQQTQDIPVIFMTALSSTEDKLKGFEVGAVDYVTKPIQPEEVLARITTHLRIQALTKELKQQTQELSQALDSLKVTQNQLIESEKMAALATLVAGVAHEINTPVGIGITAASTLADETESFIQTFEQGKLKRSTLNNYLEIATESSELILSNLHRAGELVQSFKQVAVDQSSQEMRTFAVKPYIEEILSSLVPQLKKKPHTLTVEGDETLILYSYPGAFAQIVTNLVLNSIIHGYQPGESGKLNFQVTRQGDQVIVEYTDDGCGIVKDNLKRIFEPFFTTARHQGGSGLGLHIVYNLVVQKLQGTIKAESEVGVGTQFLMTFPEIKESKDEVYDNDQPN